MTKMYTVTLMLGTSNVSGGEQRKVMRLQEKMSCIIEEQTEESYPDLGSMKRELERAQRERDKAILDRDQAALKRDQAKLDREQATPERDKAILDRDLLMAERVQ